MRYRRTYSKGAIYFFTLNLAQRDKTLLTDHIGHLRQVINQVKKRHPFILNAMVVLPDHLHAMWTLPNNDDHYSTRWRLI